MIAKRVFDLVCSTAGFVVLIPLFLVIAILIKLDSSGPVFFRQVRVGLRGKPFEIYKFRTMIEDAESSGGKITVAGDPRITRVGRLLRRFKIDELPQLFNVIKGEISLVGPRPEVPRYVALYPDDIREKVLSVPPGITDLASIEYRNENEILGNAVDPEKAYVEEIMPAKLDYYVRYVSDRSLGMDIAIILKTLTSIFTRSERSN